MRKKKDSLYNVDVYQYSQIENDLMPVLKAIIKNPRIREIKYDGLDITTSSILATSHNIKQSLTKESLAYHRKNGRTPLQVIFNKIFQMGYQQGEAKMIEDYGDMFDLMESVADNIRNNKQTDENEKL